MRLTHELESGPRGVYCGAVGVVRPGIAAGRVHATFNVPIRTVVARGTQLRCGIGSGITWAPRRRRMAGMAAQEGFSRTRCERACSHGGYGLISTFARPRAGWRFHPPARHVTREDAARHFGRPCTDAVLEQALQQLRQAHASGHGACAWRWMPRGGYSPKRRRCRLPPLFVRLALVPGPSPMRWRMATGNELAGTKFVNAAQKYDPATDLTGIALTGVLPNLLGGRHQDAGQDHRRVHRPGQGPSRQVQLREPGHRVHAAFLGRAIKKIAGVDIVHVPYKGSAAMTSDLAGGNLDFATPLPWGGSVHPERQDQGPGDPTAHRIAMMKDVPALGENAALKGYALSGWFAGGGPRTCLPRWWPACTRP
ncbi:Bifunctional 3'-phosphoadenosine 5'-phosphosulfate synthase 2 [Manis javanica]|nr:Bifunctional 3'-phosphoadenosine 5'-phosphosulfate synthase 2 [Manis javanica]